MKRLFGSKKEAVPVPTLGEAGSSVGTRVDALDARIAKLDTELRGHKDKLKTAKGAAKQQLTKRAMDVLKKKRMFEQQRDQLSGQQFNIEQASFAMDSVKDTVSTVAAMKSANAQLKKQTKAINIDEIEDITDDLADMMEDMNEINDALGRSYATPDDIDEADLEAELDLLGEELEMEDNEVEVGATPAYLQPQAEMPSQPTGVPVGVGGNDEFGLPVTAPQAL